MGAGAQNEGVAIGACLLSTLIHLTFHPGYSLTVASLEKKEKKSIQHIFIALTGVETFYV